MKSRIALFALTCAFATACAGPTHDVATMQRAQYSLDEGTASVLVRDAMNRYPLVERGENDCVETKWLRGRDGSAYKLVAHIDGPGGGPFMVRVDMKLRERNGAIFEHDVPAWLVSERDRLVVGIYDRMKPTAIKEEPPATVAGR